MICIASASKSKLEPAGEGAALLRIDLAAGGAIATVSLPSLGDGPGRVFRGDGVAADRFAPLLDALLGPSITSGSRRRMPSEPNRVRECVFKCATIAGWIETR